MNLTLCQEWGKKSNSSRVKDIDFLFHVSETTKTLKLSQCHYVITLGMNELNFIDVALLQR